MSQSIEVILAGITLNINTDDKPEHVRAAAQMVQEQFDELKSSGAIINTNKIMALIALNLADELLNKSSTNPEVMQHIISSLDQVIAQAEGLANVSLR
ncbi:MAG: cell division protein ZapA [Mariprofundaceae bacterium]|nr:cell division protein ZapA [Mariprofundaceae bacterium]